MGSKAYIGTSGWNYKSWRHSFYGDTPQKQWLPFCAERFTAIEVNGTFYRLQQKATYQKWRDKTPDGSPLHTAERAHPKVRLALQQIRAQEMGCTHPALAQGRPRRARLLRQRRRSCRSARCAYASPDVALIRRCAVLTITTRADRGC